MKVDLPVVTLSEVVNQSYLAHDYVRTEQVLVVWDTPAIAKSLKPQYTKTTSTLEEFSMQELRVENVEEFVMGLYWHLTERYILPFDEPCECLRVIVRYEHAIIENQFWDHEPYWIVYLRSNLRVRLQIEVRLHADLQIPENERIFSILSLEQVWVVAHFPKLHNKIHQVFHFLLALCKSEQVLGRYLVSDPLVQDPLSECHVTE